MHEVAVAEALLQRAAEAAERAGLTVVQSVGVRVGELSGVAPQALAFAFEMLRSGPVLGQASLQIRETAGDDLHLEWIEGES
jgi:hydrogenase nickel incorporation protein HypA/HybF